MFKNPSSSNSYRSAEFPILSLLRSRPQALATIAGSPEYPHIAGIARFYATAVGTLLYVTVRGLPEAAADEPCDERIFGFHIHEGNSCTGNASDPFADALTHYDPDGCEHPYHAGDLPPLFGCDGLAVSLFLTNRFTVEEVIGKTMILHDMPDDFTTQPSGNSGTKIACGVIRRN